MATNSLDQRIDALYQLPLAEFTAARNALAKTLTGDEAHEVRALKKPTAVPWAVNQLFGRARPIYDRVIEKGQALRTAQLAALQGKAADVRSATEAHRQAIAEAVHRALHVAGTAGLKPDADLLAQMLDALSTAASRPMPAGRLTGMLQPAGFETLAGVTIAKPGTSAGRQDRAPVASRRESDRVEHARKAEQQRDAEAQVDTAALDLERAVVAESTARQDLDGATAAVRLAEKALAAARARLKAI